MESIDSSSNYTKATSSFDAKNETLFPGGGECDDNISITSSPCKSSINGPYSPKLKKTGIKYKSNNNQKTLRSFGGVRSFRRRTKTRLVRSTVAVESYDAAAAASHSGSLVDSSSSPPHYLKETSSSQGKKMPYHLNPRHSESPFDCTKKNSSPVSQSKLGSPDRKPLRILSRMPSSRSMGFLVRKTSFKPQRIALDYSKVSEDVSVNRATYSSTIKEAKFPAEPVEIHHVEMGLKKHSAMKVCRYHHCSLHGHCHGADDPAPLPKRSLPRRRWSLKKQRSMKPKTDSWHGAKQSSDGKNSLLKSQISATVKVEPSNQESIRSSSAFSEDPNKISNSYAEISAEQQESQLCGDGCDSIPESGPIKFASGETSSLERSYQENQTILGRYSYTVEDSEGASSGLNGQCTCCCHNQGQVMSTSRTGDAVASLSASTFSGPENFYEDKISQNGNGDVKMNEQASNLVKDDSTLRCANDALNEYHPPTPVTAEATENNSVSYSPSSESQTLGHINSDEEKGHWDSNPIKDDATLSCANDALNEDHPPILVTTEGAENDSVSPSEGQTSSHINSDDEGGDRDVKMNSPPDGNLKVDDDIQDSVTNARLQFSRRRHVSMWHLIHQHMSSNMVAESTETPLQVTGGESPVDDANTPIAREISTLGVDLSGSHVGVEDNEPEIQEIEVRKLFAIKLVREAIEKILLPEVQDQGSDDQSVTSESTPRAELVENNQRQVFKQEDCRDNNGDVANTSKASGSELMVTLDIPPRPEIMKTEKKVISKSGKKAPKHWSNLKKWILLQRFIKALEKVRTYNPRKPQHLPLNSDPEAEKVNLRPQTVDGKKNAEEWMLDYALRQAVSQLAPTQKKKVALLVKAFETVVPPQEEIPFRIPRRDSVSKDPASENGKPSSTAQSLILGDNIKSGALWNTFLQASGSDTVNLDEITENGTKLEMYPSSSILSDNEKLGALWNTLHQASDSDAANLKKVTANGTESEVYSSTAQNLILCDNEHSGALWNTLRQASGSDTANLDKITENGTGQEVYPSGSILGDNEKSGALWNTLHRASDSDAVNLDKITANRTEQEATPKMKGLQVAAAAEFIEGKANDSGDQNIHADRKSHIKMWHMVCHHVVTDIVEKVGSKLFDGAEDDGSEESKSPAMNKGNHSYDFPKSSDGSSNLTGSLTKSDVLKLIKDAVDEILLQDTRDESSDAQSVTSESSPDLDISERNLTEIEGPNASNESEPSMNEKEKTSSGQGIINKPEGEKMINKPEGEKIESQGNKKFEVSKSKNWSKVRKFMLLKKSIRALEKARNRKTQTGELLPQMPDPESEKVELRTQMMDERKKAEQWMLDYAVQHIVTKLTPARKRRVSLLVEAFEAVVPFPDI